MRRNRFARNDGGADISGSHNVIARQPLPRDGSGIAIAKGRRNLVARNVVIRPALEGHQPRTRLCRWDFDPRSRQHRPPKRGQRERRRRVPGQRGGHNYLKRNVASRAKEDGFDVESRSTKLTNNRATRNADLGISAVKGVTDGGGNVARKNRDRRQCRHIACK